MHFLTNQSKVGPIKWLIDCYQKCHIELINQSKILTDSWQAIEFRPKFFGRFTDKCVHYFLPKSGVFDRKKNENIAQVGNRIIYTVSNN